MHPFHIVTLSPWPLFVSLILLSLGLNIVSWLTTGNNGYSLLFVLFSLIFISSLWFRDIIREGLGGYTTKIVQRGLLISFLIFLITEILIFAGFFWAFFDFSLAPGIELGSVWPPVGITPINVFSVPLLGCALLLSGGFFLTQGHHHFLNAHKSYTLINFFIATFLTFGFLSLQVIEFLYSEFTISDSAFGTVFFSTVGLHLLHCIFAFLFLAFIFYRTYIDQFTIEHALCLDFGIMYFHLVDFFYVLLILCFYWWGGN